MTNIMRGLESSEQTRVKSILPLLSRWASAAAILFFSLAYFSQTLLCAWQKRFWFDELCTYYICRQPSFRDSWTAVMHGADFNPPLFYLIQRADAAVFGFGSIGFRLPEILAFWILCVCLFFVVRRSAGVLGGFAAMSLPFVSGAYYYAYEARPHGIVLGFAGLALLCCFHLLDKPRSPLWLAGFALSLEAAFFVHCYALALVVPFTFVQLVRDAHSRTINWHFWLALGLPTSIAVFAFVPLLRDYYRIMRGTAFVDFFPPALSQFPKFYAWLLEPCILVLLLGVLILAFDTARWVDRRERADEEPARRRWLLALAVAFLGLPLYGIVLGKAVHGPFFARYFISAIIGAALALGYGVGGRRRGPARLAIVACLAGLVGWSPALVIWHWHRGNSEPLVEPSSGYLVDTNHDNNLATYPLLTSADPNLPIAIPSNLDFLYLAHYWPDGRSRISHVVSATGTTEYRTTIGLARYCHLNVNEPLLWRDFLQKHRDFLVYSSQRGNYPFLTELIKQGAVIRELEFASNGSFLANIQMREGAPMSENH